MKIDCHDHTCYSPDSERTPREAVEEAVGLGIGVLAFTEHMDLGFPNDKRPEGELIFDYRVTRKYFEDIEALREEFRGKMDFGHPDNDIYQRVQYMKYFPHDAE